MSLTDNQSPSLYEASRLLFGDSAELRMVNPSELHILKENARFFKKEMFKQLTDNIRKDGRLSSVPLCHVVGGGLEVLSGNHRVQASVSAGIPLILVIVLLKDLKKSEKIAIQISHNALVGEDDQQILAKLWQQIEEIDAKCYAGLSSEQIGDLQKIKLVNFSTPAIKSRQITFCFTASEMEEFETILAELGSAPGDVVYLAELDRFDAFFRAVQATKKAHNIKNGALAIRKLVELSASFGKGEV